MKASIARALFFGMLVSLFPLAAHADSIPDPTIVIRDPVCMSNCMTVGTSFTFGTPASGTGVLFFQNGSGVDWFNLSLTESGVDASVITCITTAFANCSVTTVNGLTTIFVSGLNSSAHGILNGSVFSIVFGCETGKCDPWPGDLEFTAHANVPEPASMLLVATGIGAMVSRRKRWKLAR